MHPLHDYVAKQLADKLKSRRVVVWYDERSEFQPFVDEVRGGPRVASESVSVTIGGASARIAEYAGSMFELRAVVEPHVSGDDPTAAVVYVAGVTRDRRASVPDGAREGGHDVGAATQTAHQEPTAPEVHAGRRRRDAAVRPQGLLRRPCARSGRQLWCRAPVDPQEHLPRYERQGRAPSGVAGERRA